MDILRNRTNEEDIPLRLTAMKTYSRGIAPSTQAPARQAKRSEKKSREADQHEYIPEKHERKGSKFCTFCYNFEGDNPIGHNVFECRDPRCSKSKGPKGETFKFEKFDELASRSSVERGQCGRNRRVNKVKFRGRGDRFRGQYKPCKRKMYLFEFTSAHFAPCSELF
ncbi:hypothetical protein P9112_005710 [Eukaryota sp. TZLM1-RC]